MENTNNYVPTTAMPPKPNNPPSAAPTLLTPQPPSASLTASGASPSPSSKTNVKVKQPSQKQKKSGAAGGKTKLAATATTMSSSFAGGGGTPKVPSSASFHLLHKQTLANSSTTSASSTPMLSSTVTSEKQLAQFKIERALIAERELAEMDAVERAFREDDTVWSGPMNVVFPRRYHASTEILFDKNNSKRGSSRRGSRSNTISSSPIPFNSTQQNQHYYGSQSRGWMYSEGYAGIGGRSWMEATTMRGITSSSSSSTIHKQKQHQHPSAMNNNKINPSFLLDDVTIIDNSLRANGLSRHDITPTAYACLLEQARRYTYELLANAQDYAIHAKRNSIYSLLPADILLAAEMLADSGVGDNIHGVASTLPTPEEISEFASTVNRVPLPPIPSHCYNGVALPPADEQLTARTYDVVNGARVVQRMMRGGDLPLTCGDLGVTVVARRGDDVGDGGKKMAKSSSGDQYGSTGAKNTIASMKNKPKMGSYGAGQGRQIAVRLKSKTSGANNDGSKVGTMGGGGGGGGMSTIAASGETISSTTASETKLGSKKGQKRSLREL